MELTLDEALQKAVDAHKSGQIQEADRLYIAILQAQPKHPDANHNMGVLAVGVGKVQEALPFFKTALEANPSIGQYWLSYIEALIKLDRITDAKTVLAEAKGKGAKGEAFNVLEQRLNTPNEGSIDPPQAQLQTLINLYQQGQLQQALDSAKQLLSQFPNSLTLYNIQGVAYAGLSQFDAAIYSYKQALKINPDYAKAYYNMGIALQDKGDLKAAIKSYKRAIKVRPDYAEAFNNMGNALKDKGDLVAAIDSYQQALKIKPDYADAYYNMGVALFEKDDLEAATDSYKQALKIKPDYAEAYHNMGTVLFEKGDLAAAIDSYQQALKIKPDYAEAYYNMGVALNGVAFSRPNFGLMKIIVSLLDQNTSCRPKDIALAAISLLKLEPTWKEHLEKHCLGTLRQSLQETISTLTELPLLLKLMSVCPIADLELERVLVDIRLALLSSVDEISISPRILGFQAALALQCFTNEYIYNQTDKETELLEELECVIEKTLSTGQQPSPQSILCLASYKALNNYEWCDALTANTDIEEVFARQILELKEESRLKANIPILQEITDKVSSKVREQYEENPYPRWVNLGLSLRPKTTAELIKELNLRIFDNAANNRPAPNILIAGCGTGQHSIVTASRFKDCNVLAIDLSLSSLAYAKRKTEELGLQNIDYMQADILSLNKLDKKFDIIESAGVLHHMGDPMAGWRVLTDCLESGGLMKIGLYSELARQHIVKMREEISQSRIGSSDNAMKLFRSDVINSDKVHHEQILTSGDFYSLSPLRDLLFHAQEHRFTMPQIKHCLSELGLKFCGFESGKIVKNFKLTNTGKDDPYDLDKWDLYEKDNPRSFAGMYQFWCQKVT
jgi:tetratricopeptide (TPR) repeat protein/2-polyprenyl-3-methyl-5-hydroxy-6-metoxy-1,4-benzoquinol methylase